MNPKYEILFTPTKIGSVELKNRFVMCAMESTGIINWLQGMGFNAKLRDLFIERAQDGVGLLIPGTIPLYSVPMHKWLYQNPKAFKGLSELMEEIHGYGSKMFIQLTAGFLLGKAQVGEKVAIIGGGLTGCEIAYELALQGKSPSSWKWWMTSSRSKVSVLPTPTVCGISSSTMRFRCIWKPKRWK